LKSAYKELIIVAILLGIILGIGEVLYKLKLKPIQHDITHPEIASRLKYNRIYG